MLVALVVKCLLVSLLCFLFNFLLFMLGGGAGAGGNVLWSQH